ncbi:MAG: toprim domain-containing protein [bacterium]|nr:toprim domain-containing protein [bacterium]
MTTFDKLADIFRSFPGIGPRQAKRFVYFLLSRDKEYLEELNTLVGALKDHIVQCKECFRFFQKRNGSTLCPICADPNRDSGELMIVAKDTDLEALEKSNTYFGKYFVLGGTIALVEKKNGEKLRIKELHARVKTGTVPQSLRDGARPTPLNEIILALSANPDGEHTADELKRLLAPLSVKVSTLGRGLSTGSELEYADKETIKSALKNRSV